MNVVTGRVRLPCPPGIPSLSAHVNEHLYRPTVATALILSPDPLAAALLGAAVELAGMTIAFADAGESAAQAFRRVRPAILLVDAGDESSCVAELLGPAMMTGTRSILFGGAATVAMRREQARQYRAETLVMPRDVNRLQQLLAEGVRNREPAR